MAAAAREVSSGMAALLGAEEDQAERIAADRRADGGRLWVANLNAPGQIVLAGGEDDIEWLVGAARDLGVRRAVALNVAGAFHSPLMAPAVPAVEAALAEVSFREPAFPVWANVTARPMSVEESRDLLARQVVSPVRFAESLATMAAAGVATFVHVGPGDVTAGMARRAAKDAAVLVVDSLDAVPAAVEALVGT